MLARYGPSHTFPEGPIPPLFCLLPRGSFWRESRPPPHISHKCGRGREGEGAFLTATCLLQGPF